MSIKITAAQREALYVQVLDHLSGIGDLWLAIDAGEYEKADSLGHAFADDLRLLLEDLGWPNRADLPADGSLELTMAPKTCAGSSSACATKPPSSTPTRCPAPATTRRCCAEPSWRLRRAAGCSVKSAARTTLS